jgi:hypothetical protein
MGGSPGSFGGGNPQSPPSAPFGPRGGAMQAQDSLTTGMDSTSSFGMNDLKQRVESRNNRGFSGSSRQGEIRLETNAEAERIRSDERARRLEQARMVGMEEARIEEERRSEMEEARAQQQRLQAEARARIEAEKNMSEAKKFEAVNKAIAASDDNYIPPKSVLDSKSPSPLLEQVDGPSLLKYEKKDATYSGRSTKIYGGSTLDVPIRVSAPGSIVEYTIEKKSYDFGLGIVAKLDQGGTTVVKPTALFDGTDVVADRPRQKSQSDQVLVGAGSVPCTLNFKFENKFSWITEVSYKIRVIPPSTELLVEGRRRRAAASMQALDNDIGETNMILNEIYNQGSILQNEVDTLAQQVEYVESNLQQTREEEWNIRNMEEQATVSRTGSSNGFEF